MASVVVKAGGTSLPGEVVSLARGDELLWSEGTGRSADSGKMAGSVVADKQTWTVGYGPMSNAAYASLRSALDASGFFTLSVKVAGTELVGSGKTFYRGAVSGELMGVYGGTTWWDKINVKLVER